MSNGPAVFDELEEVLAHGSVERRADALRRVTDLFVRDSDQYSAAQIALFDGIFDRLVRDIEVAARAELARRLAPIARAPDGIVRLLAFDDAIEVAGPVLTRSECLDDVVLVENAQAKSQGHLLAISRRISLSEAVTDVLVDRGDREVVKSTAQNAGARFSDTGFSTLVRRAEGDDDLATCVGLRADIPRHHFLKLLARASDTVRVKLEAENPLASREIRQVVARVANRIRTETAAASIDYAAACELVQEMHASGRLDDAAIVRFARTGKFEEMTAALALRCDLPIAAAELAMVQERAEMALVLAKAIGLSWEAAKSILFLRVGRRGTGMTVEELEQATGSYERMKTATAKNILQLYRHRVV